MADRIASFKFQFHIPGKNLGNHLHHIADPHSLGPGQDQMPVRVFPLQDLHTQPGCIGDVDVLTNRFTISSIGDAILSDGLLQHSKHAVVRIGPGSVQRAIPQDRVIQVIARMVGFDETFRGLLAGAVKRTGLGKNVDTAGEDKTFNLGEPGRLQ